MCCLFIVLSYWFFTCTVTSHVLNVIQIFFLQLQMWRVCYQWHSTWSSGKTSPTTEIHLQVCTLIWSWNLSIFLYWFLVRLTWVVVVCVIHDNSSAQARMRQKSRRRCSTDSQENEKATKKIKKVKTYWVCL